ncbi:DnaJ domain-containing protein [Colletotrichum gloeosporioides Cg-14]|uniref:DnaJ domain-containing protein n=1 Tax=Colletotrichum gloeosporioides (strain Cg-14) TaxID=1237896 RepID=T0KE22_COLGC|nr:DnaJ domain-containing protein [Colletotrichum gloeosporioides Cg-14]
MGSQQSSGRDQTAGAASRPIKTCYYELLAVERDATDDEIKKAYRKRALELHPDRNYGDVDNATRRFAEVQAAYEVLSDPQERAWYDSHREAILRGADPEDADEHGPEFNNIKLTSTDDIFSLIRRFNATVPFTDEPSGFFGIAKATFDHLLDEEVAAGEYVPGNMPDYPTFGISDDGYEDVAKPFYGAWASFSTRKTFAWKDKYRVSDAPDRRVRRLMEKENKKLRDEAIRDFNDAVRFLVTFVRKRDPRYLPNTQTAAERQESLRIAAAAQAARSRAANLEKLSDAVVPDWAQARDDADGGGHFPESEEEESEVEVLECVVCNKTFKSEKSFEAHERSKKHLRAVQQLRRQMRDEDMDLNLRESSTVQIQKSEAEIKAELEDLQNLESDTVHEVDGEENVPDVTSSTAKEAVDSDAKSESPDDDEYASRAEVEQRLFSNDTTLSQSRQKSTCKPDIDQVANLIGPLSIDNDGDDRQQPKKIGKAKAKREKKAARDAAEESQAGVHTCGVCQSTFSSKTRLFTHIRELGHATPIPKTTGSRRKKR